MSEQPEEACPGEHAAGHHHSREAEVDRALLIALGSPAAPTELARRLEVTPGAVSQHLGVLRVGHRVGRRVLYVRTDVGDALVAGAAG